MKIFFIIPPPEYNKKKSPIDRVYGCNYGYDYKPAIHFLSVATVIKKEGHNVRFLDCSAEKYDSVKFESFISQEKPDCIFFFTPYLCEEEDIKASGKVREILSKNIPAVFLGAAPTWNPGNYINDKDTFVVRGEPELSAKELIYAIEGKKDFSDIYGISFLSEGKIINNPQRDFLDINSLPIPDRTLLKGRYMVNRLNVSPVTVMCVSRGCAYRCTFCAPNAVDQAIEVEYKKYQEKYIKRPPLRKRSADKVIEEFKEIASLGFKGIEVSDNHFLWEEERTLKICEGIKDLGIEWICLARAPFLHNEKVVNALYQAGCKMVYMGTESFRQEILDDIRKQIKVEDIKKAVEVCRKCGVEPEVSVMMGGSPLESEETIDYSILEAKKLKTHFIHFSAVLPFPNTEFYDLCKEKGWLRNGEFEPVDNAREAIINLPKISAKKLEKKLREEYFKQYFSIRGIYYTLKKIRSIGDLFHKIKAASKLFTQTFFRK